MIHDRQVSRQRVASLLFTGCSFLLISIFSGRNCNRVRHHYHFFKTENYHFRRHYPLLLEHSSFLRSTTTTTIITKFTTTITLTNNINNRATTTPTIANTTKQLFFFSSKVHKHDYLKRRRKNIFKRLFTNLHPLNYTLHSAVYKSMVVYCLLLPLFNLSTVASEGGVIFSSFYFSAVRTINS